MEKGLCEICKPKQWKTISSDMLLPSGYPVYGANGVIGYYSEYNHDEKTLLITCRGATCGTLNICEPFSYVNGNAMALDNLSNEVDLRYLYYFLSARGLDDVITGSAQPQIVRQSLDKVKITYPRLEQQLKIAEVLDKVSDLIALRKQQLEKLDNLIKARFVEMFKSYARDTVKAGSLFQEIRNGVSPSTRGICAEKVLTLSAITQGAFDESAWKNGMFDETPADDKRVSETDFYICRGNGNKALVGSAVYSKQDYPDLVFPDTVIAARVDTSKVSLPYLFYAWKQPAVRMQIESGARTTNGTFKVNQKILSDIKIAVPPLDVQIQFAAFVNQVDKSKLTVQRSLDKLELLKKSMIQQYFG